MLKVRILKDRGALSLAEAANALELFLTVRLVPPGFRLEVASWSRDGGHTWTFADDGAVAALDFWPLLRTIDPTAIRLAGIDEDAEQDRP